MFIKLWVHISVQCPFLLYHFFDTCKGVMKGLFIKSKRVIYTLLGVMTVYILVMLLKRIMLWKPLFLTQMPYNCKKLCRDWTDKDIKKIIRRQNKKFAAPLSSK